MSPLEKLKLLWKLNQLTAAIESERKKGMYDIKIGLAKALRDLVITSVAVGGAAVCGYFAVPANIAAVIGFLPDTVEHALIPLISSAFVFGLNYINEKSKLPKA